MKNYTKFEKLVVSLLIVILIVVANSNWLLRGQLFDYQERGPTQIIVYKNSEDSMSEENLENNESHVSLPKENSEDEVTMENRNENLRATEEQRVSESIGEKTGDVLGQLGDGFRNVIRNLDERLNEE